MFAGSVSKHCLNFGDDGEGDLFRRFRGEMQTSRREKLGFCGRAAVDHVQKQFFTPPSRPDQTDVAQAEWQQMAQRGAIASKIMRRDDCSRAVTNRSPQLCDGADQFKIPIEQLRMRNKSTRIRAFADYDQPQRRLDRLRESIFKRRVTRDPAAEPLAVFEKGYECASPPPSNHIAQLLHHLLIKQFNKNLNAAAAAETSACVERDQLRLARCDHIPCVHRDFLFDAAGAERSRRFAIRRDQHSRAWTAIARTARPHQRRECARAWVVFLPKRNDLAQFLHAIASSLSGVIGRSRTRFPVA